MVRPSKEERSTWPENHRPCTNCFQMLPFSSYHKHSGCWAGINVVCKDCRIPKSKEAVQKQSTEYKLYHAAKSRSAFKGTEFGLELTDIVIPDKCPVFGVKFDRTYKWRPSLDRIDSTKGYTKDNVWVISNLANMMKNTATLEELRMFGKWACEVTW